MYTELTYFCSHHFFIYDEYYYYFFISYHLVHITIKIKYTKDDNDIPRYIHKQR